MFDKAVWLLLFLAAYWTFCVVISVRSAKRQPEAAHFFSPAGGIATWLFVFVATTGLFAGWAFTGQAGQVFVDGFQYLNASFFVITIPLASVLVVKRQWMLSRKFGYVTPGDMFCGYFGGEAITVIAVGIALLFAVPFLATLFGAAGSIMLAVTDGAVSRDAGMWVLASVVLLYCMVGGLNAVAQVSVAQGILMLGGIVVLGAGAASLSGGVTGLGRALAKIASTPLGRPGMTHGFGGSDDNGLFVVPGVIQFTAGLGRQVPVGGPWTAMMSLSFVLSFMGLQLSPAFSVWSFVSRSPRGFPIHQIWGSALCVGLAVFIFAPLQGLAGLVLGASGPVNAAGLAVARVLAPLQSGEQGALVLSTINILGGQRIWLVGLLSVAGIAALQATAAVFLATTGNIISRDIYRRYVRPDAPWYRQKAVSRLAMLLVCLAALLMASFANTAVLVLASLAIPCSFQLLPSLLGVLWLPWITRGAATAGLIAGLIAVVLTEPLGQVVAGNALPWGRWPWTIHSGIWGMLANGVVCLAVCASARTDPTRPYRDTIHAFLNDRTWSLAANSARMKSAAWVLLIGWLFFAAGPGAVLGNRLFGAPGAGYQAWVFGVPSLWAWQVFWWVLGIGLVWFLAVKLGLSTGSLSLAALEPAGALARRGDHDGQ